MGKSSAGIEFGSLQFLKAWSCTVHTHSMEIHSMEKVPSMEKFSINQTEYYIKHEVFGKKILERV